MQSDRDQVDKNEKPNCYFFLMIKSLGKGEATSSQNYDIPRSIWGLTNGVSAPFLFLHITHQEKL